MKKWKKYNYGHIKWWKYLKMKRISSESSMPVYRWLKWVWIPDKYEYQALRYKEGQRTFIYCPYCNMELISSNSHIPTDVPLDLEYFQCKNCLHLTEWNFDMPAPILLNDYGDKDEAYNKLEEIGYYDSHWFKEYGEQLMEELE